MPVEPVPFTLQTLAVILAGMLLGWRLGLVTVLAWLAAGAAGLPVFSGGSGGWQKFLSETGGYLAGFPIAAAVTGWLGERGWGGRKPFHAFAAAMIGHALCLLPGALWLSTFVGRNDAIAQGLLPFLPGAILKSIAAVLVLMLFKKR
ncbi:biotin transporter BioY [Allosphingosinicella flava]|uniref:Biotin transporter n=1 Tax=Allosphingosinicella flava TaxID=2771430 RepID=A0A7T2GJQ7_9SPHN|nr:biotin transporter BioY [Sphingosinicella flava]QPQ55129.1 biotin transporter BioY [Sphingosinicella flava]